MNKKTKTSFPTRETRGNIAPAQVHEVAQNREGEKSAENDLKNCSSHLYVVSMAERRQIETGLAQNIPAERGEKSSAERAKWARPPPSGGIQPPSSTFVEADGESGKEPSLGALSASLICIHFFASCAQLTQHIKITLYINQQTQSYRETKGRSRKK